MKFAMKSLLKLLAVALGCLLYTSTFAFSADKTHELLMLEAAKNVEFVSQKIAKAYFYKQQGVRPDRAAEALKKGLVLLEKDLIIIQEGVEEDAKEEKNIAVFLEYTMDELKDIVNQPYSKENGALLIDYSESLLEGAASIAQGHVRKGNAEEKMLVSVKHTLFLLERINKLYIAYKAGFNDYNNIIQLKQAVQDFESTLAKVNAYTKYEGVSLTSRNKINEFWPVAKEFFIDIEKGALPVIVLTSVEKLVKELKVLESFHHSKSASNTK